jgi:hypothetical protein
MVDYASALPLDRPPGLSVRGQREGRGKCSGEEEAFISSHAVPRFRAMRDN